jgi:hypothetical protein
MIWIVLASLAGLAVTLHYLRKNWQQIRAKNAKEPVAWKRALNYPFTVVWYGYLIVFFVCLTINNF